MSTGVTCTSAYAVGAPRHHRERASGSTKRMGANARLASRCVLHTASPEQVCWESFSAPTYWSPLHWAQTVSLMTTTSEWPHRFCLTADALCVLPPYPGYYPTRGPRCCLLPEAKK